MDVVGTQFSILSNRHKPNVLGGRDRQDRQFLKPNYQFLFKPSITQQFPSIPSVPSFPLNDTPECITSLSMSNFVFTDSSEVPQIPSLPPPLPDRLSPSRSDSFFIRRVRRIPFRPSLLFHFFSDGQPVFSAKTRRIHSGAVFVSESPTVHIRPRQYDWVLRVSKNQCAFELLQKDTAAKEMYVKMTSDGDSPRKTEIDIAPNEHLESQTPVLKANGKWCLPFTGKYVVPSLKNAILLDGNRERVVLVRKIQKGLLEIEAKSEFSPLHLFVIGIASFVCQI
jgi:hypothetical protein